MLRMSQLRGVELSLLTLVLLLSTGGFIHFLQGTVDLNTARTGNWLTNGIWVISYLLATVALYTRAKLRRAALRRCWPLFLLVSFALLSIIWSEDRYLTFLRTGALAGTIVGGLYLGERLTLGAQVRLLTRVLGAAAVLSVLFVLFLPQWAIGTGDFQSDWLGIFGHKNLLGLNMAMGFGVFAALFRSSHRGRFAYFAWAVFCLILVFLSGSATGLVCCAGEALVLFVAGPVVKIWSRLTRIRRVLVIAMAAMFATVLAGQYEVIPDLLGRDAGLTGRTTMWSLVAIMISEKPWFGYGYGAFWRGYAGPSGAIWDALGGEIFYSHNGFLDVWLDIGAIGLGLLLLGYIIAFRRAVISAGVDRSDLSLWPLVFLMFLLLSNLTEGSLMRANTLPWILYTAIYYRLAIYTEEAEGIAAGLIPATRTPFPSAHPQTS